MKFYFAADHYFGDEMELSPRIPTTIQDEEDNKTKRICISSSIIGALSSICQHLSTNCPVFIYETEVDKESKYLYQPKPEEVFDVEYTGEFWLLKKSHFKLIKMIEIDKIIPITISETPTNMCTFKEIFNKNF